MNYICILLLYRACKTPLGVRVETGGPIFFFLYHTFIFHIFYFNKSPIILWGHSMKVYNCLFFVLFMSSLSLLASTGITQPDSVSEYEIDAMPISLDLGLEPGQMVYQYDELTISCRIKNNGTSAIGPVPLVLCITFPSRNGQTDTLYIKNDQSPPLLSGDSSRVLSFNWKVITDLEKFIISIESLYGDDQNPYNNKIEKSFLSLPDDDDVIECFTHQDNSISGLPVYTSTDSFFIDNQAKNWVAIDSTYKSGQNHINAWHVEKSYDYNPIKFVIDRTLVDINDYSKSQNPLVQHQNETLLSPIYDLEPIRDGGRDIYLFFHSKITGTGGHDYPFNANVEITTDSGKTWNTIRSFTKKAPCNENNIDHDKYYTLDIDSLVKDKNDIQLRFRWFKSMDTFQSASWEIDTILLMGRLWCTCDWGVNSGTNIPDRILQNYPNPFNPQTTIQYRVEKDAHTKLTIYDILGREIITLVDKQQTAGIYTIPWNSADASGNRVPSGVYFYKLVSGNQSQIRKMTLVH